MSSRAESEVYTQENLPDLLCQCQTAYFAVHWSAGGSIAPTVYAGKRRRRGSELKQRAWWMPGEANTGLLKFRKVLSICLVHVV